METAAEFLSECSQLPAVQLSDGTLKAMGPDFRALPDRLRDQIVQSMGGRLIWIKVQVVYTLIPHRLCNRKDCYRLAETDKEDCGAHR